MKNKVQHETYMCIFSTSGFGVSHKLSFEKLYISKQYLWAYSELGSSIHYRKRKKQRKREGGREGGRERKREKERRKEEKNFL